jgi:transposase
MEAHGPLQEADEEDGRLLYQRARRGGLEMAGDGFQELSCSSGRRENGQEPHRDRGKRGAKINLLLNERGAPLSVVLTGSNRHDKISAVDLIVSIVLKRPAHKEQHLCADKAYVASEVREFAASEGNTAHIKTNPRTADGDSDTEDLKEKTHPARRWVVERTIYVVDQTSRSAHPLVQEVRELAGIDSVGLRSRSAQLGGFRIES